MFNIDFQSRIPIYEQIVNQVERFILFGILKENEQLPSVRQMAFDLGINPNTIQRAYTELEHKGITVSVVGKGNFIVENTQDIISKKIEEKISFIQEEIVTLKELGLNEDEIKKRIFKSQD